jgi:hypothetical protein
MSLKARKEKLIQDILQTTDESLIGKVEQLFSTFTESKDWAWDLSEAQREGIRVAQRAMDNGDGISDEQVWAEFSQRFRNHQG